MISSITSFHNGAFNLVVSLNGYPKASFIGIPNIEELRVLRNIAYSQLLCMN